VNRWVTLWLVAYPSFHSLVEYRTSHLIHHRDLGEEHDPDLIAYRKQKVDQLPVSSQRFFLYYVLWNEIRVPFLQLTDLFRRMIGIFTEPWSHRLGRWCF
jgi:fatty acid desaturase